MEIIEHGNIPNEVEIYNCEYCGCKFELPIRERHRTFVFHEPHNWPCPECGHNCFTMKKVVRDN